MYKTYTTGILFYYSAEEIWDAIKMYSAYPVRGLVENEKAPVIPEELIFSDDEEALFVRECTNAFNKVFDIAHKLSMFVSPQAVFFNKRLAIVNDPAIPIPAIGVVSYGFTLINKNGYNVNLLPMIDNYIKELSINMIKQEWWLLTRQNDMASNALRSLMTVTPLYTNSLFELYRPYIFYGDLSPEIVTVIIDDEETTTVTPTPTPSVPEIEYYNDRDSFPVVGVVDILYIDRETGNMYHWNNSTSLYVAYLPEVNQVSFTFEDTEAISCTHNLGIYMPNVTVEDVDGVPFVVDIVPIDLYTTLLQWNQPKSGIAYFTA